MPDSKPLPRETLVRKMLSATTSAEIASAQKDAKLFLEEWPMNPEVMGASEQLAMLDMARSAKGRNLTRKKK